MPRRKEQSMQKHMQRPRLPVPVSLPLSTEPLLDMDGVCQFLQLGKTKVSELIHKEGLPYHSFGRRAYRFDKSEVRQWLQNRRELA
jgi:excisionase family DNA binding protein